MSSFIGASSLNGAASVARFRRDVGATLDRSAGWVRPMRAAPGHTEEPVSDASSRTKVQEVRDTKPTREHEEAVRTSG